MKRKHIRTRVSEINFANDRRINNSALKPGIYRIHSAKHKDSYIASFEIRQDHTVSFYGFDLIIRKGGE